MGSNPLEFFHGKTVMVEGYGFRLVGKLVHAGEGNHKGHLPNVLILETTEGSHILRGNWLMLTEVSS